MTVPTLSPAELASALELRDLTDPARGPHAMQLLVESITTALRDRWRCAVQVVRGHPVVSTADNYEHLGYAPDAVTRDARYTRYVGETRVLRSHTSAMVPAVLRRLAAAAPVADVLLVCPGLCYRRDAIDWQHTGTPHQLDLWRIRHTRAGDPLPAAEDDLVAMIGAVVEAAVPGARWRTVPSPHPYTTGGRQIDVWHEGAWVEVGECGLAAPAVLARAGLRGPRWSGLAMGCGLDRLLMLRKNIPDIRLLRSADRRVADQLLDLDPYRPVSSMPPVRRDVSVAVGPGTDVSAEALGDRVRAALGSGSGPAGGGTGSDVVETVELLGETAYADLPEPARRRLGIAAGQRNVLVRVVLRALDRSLTDAEANGLRDRIYAALHEGDRS